MTTLSAPHIYAEQLMPRGYGLPLWKPEPPRTGEIEIGDIGFLQNGQFCRLFNAMRLPSDPINSLGVPRGFTPLVLPEHLLNENEDFLPQGPIYNKRSVQLKCSGGLAANMAGSSGAAASYSFNCSNTRGAVAVLGSTGKMSQVWRNWVIPAYITENLASWYSFALEKGYDVQPGDLIFVSSFVKAAEWGIAAFAAEGRCHDVSFSGSVGAFANAHFGVSASDERAPFIEQRCGPRRPSEDTRACLPKNQSLFISYYKQKSRGPFSAGRSLAVTTKGDPRDIDGAGERRSSMPRQLQSEGSGLFARLRRKDSGGRRRTSKDSSSSESEASDAWSMHIPGAFEEIPGSLDDSDVLDYLLDYIIECSTAKTAVACHNDLYEICGLAERRSDWPEDLPAHIRKVAPWININEHGVGTIGDIPKASHDVFPVPRKSISQESGRLATCEVSHTASSSAELPHHATNPLRCAAATPRLSKREKLMQEIRNQADKIRLLMGQLQAGSLSLQPGTIPYLPHTSLTAGQEITAPPNAFVSPRTRQKNKALLIGINYCHNPGGSRPLGEPGSMEADCESLKQLLTERYGYLDEDITTMKEDHYTRRARDNILRETRRLTQDAKAGDTFVFYYAGHGYRPHSLVLDDNPEPTPDQDEEVREADAISDEVLQDILTDSLPNGCKMTMILDSCHCGTLLDLPPTTGHGVSARDGLPLQNSRSGDVRYWAPNLAHPSDAAHSDGRGRSRRPSSGAMEYTHSEHIWKSNSAGGTVLHLRSVPMCDFTHEGAGLDDLQERKLRFRVVGSDQSNSGYMPNALASSLHENATLNVQDAFPLLANNLFKTSRRKLEVSFSTNVPVAAAPIFGSTHLDGDYSLQE